MSKKKIIILEHSGGRLANQLWNFISIFAFGKEKGYKVVNYSFTDYYPFFEMKAPNIFIKILSTKWIRENKLVISIRPYRRYINFIKKYFSKNIIDSKGTVPVYLSPTPSKIKDVLNTIYMKDWMFRNPVGIEKYRNGIFEYFKPNRNIQISLDLFFKEIRKKNKHIIGVHIRQGDYKTFKNINGDSLYFEQSEVRKILDEYLKFSGFENKETLFVICSDEDINDSQFAELNIIKGQGTAVEDLFTLSRTDCVIGSDSTFGAFASYYGNIPFIIFERPMIDWDYYRGKDKYFENKKSTVVFY